MSGVASRLKQTLFGTYRTLSVDSDSSNESKLNKEKSSILDSLITKFSQNHDHVVKPSCPDQNANNRDHKILLIIDSPENEWGKIFRGKRLHEGEIEIKIEQATFSELQILSSTERGANVIMKVVKNGQQVVRMFRPDFVLIREYITGPDKKNNHKDFLLGLMHGLVPAVNSLFSAYNFLDKPAVYAELLRIQQNLGCDIFPLIKQTYYQSFNEMLIPPPLPVVVKIGSVNSGYGKVCVASTRGFQDVTSIVAMTNNYATSEPFLDGKFDIRILKLGQRYKVFKRKSLTDSWKTNTGSSSIEEIALTERYKKWADECSTLFGGLDIICVEAIHTVDDKEFIVEVNDIPKSISLDKLEDDMKCIANVVIKRMETHFKPPIGAVKKNLTNKSLNANVSMAEYAKSTLSPFNATSPKQSPHHTEKIPRPGSAPPLELSGSGFASPLLDRKNVINDNLKLTRNRKSSIAELIFGTDKI
ncbi:synapsin-2 isoform X1 [Hydra vulgaris]|uniref:synapsin-2 isoform X1 n=1 Tax=Hydra vulgaris TaxID=6087 RepID=UPI001F5F65E0|nr:synapsin-2 [Hydra vulgaris]